jgi:hypothetical protein
MGEKPGSVKLRPDQVPSVGSMVARLPPWARLSGSTASSRRRVGVSFRIDLHVKDLLSPLGLFHHAARTQHLNDVANRPSSA